MVKMSESGVFDLKKFEDVDYVTGLIRKEGAGAVGTYLREMNRLGKEMGMMSTNIANAHGLSNTSSYSTANDLCKLCTVAMKNDLFRNIVQTRQY